MTHEPRELFCMVCEREYPVWFADSPLWNYTIRKADGSDTWPFLCPTCFMIKARERGIESTFRVSLTPAAGAS